MPAEIYVLQLIMVPIALLLGIVLISASFNSVIKPGPLLKWLSRGAGIYMLVAGVWGAYDSITHLS